MQKLFQSNRNNQDIFLIRRVLKGRAARMVWGHSPPENFELLILWNAISGVLRGQFLSKMSAKSIVILCLFLFAWFRVQVLDFILYYFVQFLKFSGHQFLLSIICYVFLYKYHKSSFGNVKIEIFFLPWSHIGRDSGFSSKIGRIPMKSGWTVGKKINLTMKILYWGFIQ